MSLINFDNKFNTDSDSSSEFPLTFYSCDSSISNDSKEHETQEYLEEDSNLSIGNSLKKEKKTIIPKPIKGIVWSPHSHIKNEVFNNITVELYSENNFNTPIRTTKSDINGFFIFDNIDLGNYFIKPIIPKNYKIIEKGAYSSINNNTLLSDKIFNDNENITIYIGLIKTFKVCGMVLYNPYNSPNYSNLNGINNLSLNLLNESNEIISSTLTTSILFINGYFEFTNLTPGTYKIALDNVKKYMKISPLTTANFSKSNSNIKINENNLLEFKIFNSNLNNLIVSIYPLKS